MNLRVSFFATIAIAWPASAQAQVATYQVRFANGLSTINLAPGQSTTVHMHVSFEPGVGGAAVNGPLSGPVAGLSDGAFDIAGQAPPGVTGAWTIDISPFSPGFALPNPWGAQSIGSLSVYPGITSGISVGGVYWGYGFLLGTPHPFPQNPAMIWRATFTAAAGSDPGLIQLNPVPLLDTGVFVGYSAGLPFVAYFKPQSAPATITIICYPDCDASGALTIADFGCFQSKFVAQDPYADCNQGGTFTIADFGCFQGKFVAGCP